VNSILDPRMETLLRAGDAWRRSVGPDRRVLDQVYLVPDVPSFFEAIGQWDERQFFPVLIDDPAWTLPFLRAFRPARVVRFGGAEARGRETGGVPSVEGPPMPERQRTWLAARRAVARAWTSDSIAEEDLPPAGGIPRKLGPTPPGLVFSNPESPMLAGAVALAAGRFEPLVRLEPIPANRGWASAASSAASKRFADRLSLAEARAFARKVEALAAAVAGHPGELGDRCDFLTLAGDWPYAYRNDVESGRARGEHALDDLIGRELTSDEGGLELTRTRWAFTGRLLGSAPASVFRAMCALFLQPDACVLWNTYGEGSSWSGYEMAQAARVLGHLWPPAASTIHRAGSDADLAAWHRVFDPVNRFGWIMVNSSGYPRQFSIAGGTGLPADLPRGRPAAVSIIHSFSAADPTDPSTLAGRWLENGAFVYYGAMNEPYLNAFRPPKLVAELAAAELPLSAVLRQGEYEPFGRPWRLVYLGDPLYRFHSRGSHSPRNRLAPTSWPAAAHPLGRSTAVEINAWTRPDLPAAEADRLRWCLTMAIAALCRTDRPGESGERHDGASASPPDWRPVLLEIDRSRLEPGLRSIQDELVVDSLLNDGGEEPLLVWLLRIPPAESAPRLRRALETTAMSWLADLGGALTIELRPAFDLWDRLIRRSWPTGSEFPAQFTERLAALVNLDPDRNLEPYQQHLLQAADWLAANPEPLPQAAVVQAELERVEAVRGRSVRKP
jgi:hypothetical protein